MQLNICISIHALLAESDNINSSVTTADKISIHALLAESDTTDMSQRFIKLGFLSTLSLRRATAPSPPKQKFYKISIHALLAESDSSIDDLEPSKTHFYPRSPCGERHVS